MKAITTESIGRVEEILEDIGYACEIDDYYEDWEDVARPSFCTFMDDLDTEQYDNTCAAILERINDLNGIGRHNYAMGILTAFRGYLDERRDYLEFNGYSDKPELPEDADEDDKDLYEELMERYEAYESYVSCVDKWIEEMKGVRI